MSVRGGQGSEYVSKRKRMFLPKDRTDTADLNPRPTTDRRDDWLWKHIDARKAYALKKLNRKQENES